MNTLHGGEAPDESRDCEHGGRALRNHAFRGYHGQGWKLGKIVVLETAVFTTLTDPHRDGTEIAGVSFPAGAVIHGAFEAIELASGKVLAYRG